VAASFNVGADPVDFVEGIPNLAIIAEELTAFVNYLDYCI